MVFSLLVKSETISHLKAPKTRKELCHIGIAKYYCSM
jgi:hypothetical protein